MACVSIADTKKRKLSLKVISPDEEEACKKEALEKNKDTDDEDYDENLSTPGYQLSETGSSVCIALDDGQSIKIASSGTYFFNVEQEPSGSPFMSGIKWRDLKLGICVGKGSQGQVTTVKHKVTGETFAVKGIEFLEQNLIAKKSLKLELSRILASKHPNIVSYMEAFFVKDKVLVLLEYMNFGSLSSILQKIGPFPLNAISKIATHLLQGLQHLHSHGIVHRDIKPGNILVNSNGEVKISDFGVSTTLRFDLLESHSRIGSTSYMSPERMRGEGHNSASDIWSVGVTLAECSLGVYPLITEDFLLSMNEHENPFIASANLFDLSVFIADGKINLELNLLRNLVVKHFPNCSSSFDQLVTCCIDSDPRARPSCEDLLLCSAFLNEHRERKFDLKNWLNVRLRRAS